ncbi:MAG: ZIP family metal transporter [Candidatus Paceibacterota bacterium]
MSQILLFSILVMLASLIGVITVWKKAGKIIEKNLSFLVSFSAGVFLVITYQLSRETLEHAADPLSGILWILAGVVLIWGLFKIIPGFHHHHDESSKDHSHSKIDARRILLSDAVHNVGDGMLLAVAFIVNPALGALTAVSVFIHELVQEVSEFFVLRQAGYSTKKALMINFLVSGTILIGSLGSFFLLDLFETLETPLLGIAAGAFLIVVLHDLIPHSVRESKSKTHHLKHISWFVLGLVIMAGVNLITVHSHDLGDGHGHGHDETELMDDHHHDEYEGDHHDEEGDHHNE